MPPGTHFFSDPPFSKFGNESCPPSRKGRLTLRLVLVFLLLTLKKYTLVEISEDFESFLENSLVVFFFSKDATFQPATILKNYNFYWSVPKWSEYILLEYSHYFGWHQMLTTTFDTNTDRGSHISTYQPMLLRNHPSNCFAKPLGWLVLYDWNIAR